MMRCAWRLALSGALIGLALVSASASQETVGPATGTDQAFIQSQIRRWTEEVRKDPQDFETLAAIGAAFGKLGQHAAAIEYFRRAIAVNPKYAEAYVGMASVKIRALARLGELLRLSGSASVRVSR